MTDGLAKACSPFFEKSTAVFPVLCQFLPSFETAILILYFGKSGFIDFKSMKKIQPTIFSLYGNKIFLLVILMYIVMITLLIKIKHE